MGQNSAQDEAGRVLGLETAWSHAIEEKNANALDVILADSFVVVDIDGSLTHKAEFLAGIRDPQYQPWQAVYQQMVAHMYDDAATTTGIFRIKETDQGKIVLHRKRFHRHLDQKGQSWQCVASQVTLIPAKDSP